MKAITMTKMKSHFRDVRTPGRWNRPCPPLFDSLSVVSKEDFLEERDRIRGRRRAYQDPAIVRRKRKNRKLRIAKVPSPSRLPATSFMDFWEETTSGKLEKDVDDPVPTMYTRLITWRLMSTMPTNWTEKMRIRKYVQRVDRRQKTRGVEK